MASFRYLKKIRKKGKSERIWSKCRLMVYLGVIRDILQEKKIFYQKWPIFGGKISEKIGFLHVWRWRVTISNSTKIWSCTFRLGTQYIFFSELYLWKRLPKWPLERLKCQFDLEKVLEIVIKKFHKLLLVLFTIPVSLKKFGWKLPKTEVLTKIHVQPS